jgi:superfamily II RNA helicase
MVFLCDQPYTQELEAFAQFPYPLSDFQKYAIEGILKGNHVLVTAHTGSGKTLPAEFAIQHFVSQGKKVIYTSPIKALSNQKFYDFTQKYPHISFGLLTGDIKTNPTAQVLIMTTEILMNALFNKTNQKIQGDLSFQMDIDKELGCVIFDEVHYINDAHRGQTWEQTILMLPLHIQMVMLSATIDNPQGFAEWIERRDPAKTSEVYLASTEHRVVPLTHYGFFATTETPFKATKDKALHEKIRAATNKLLLLKSPQGQFNEPGFTTLHSMTTLFDKYEWRMKRQFVLNKLVGHLKENEMLPAIVFVFSRKAVEQCAHEITTNLLEDDSKVPYTIARECEQIVRRFPNYKEYLHLPEYVDLVHLLEKGIGIHHSGMMPVLREIVELMISKKYIKLLFATESFAIGLDCPIKTAVFSSLKKFDGTHMRYILPHEYTQMAGRAGRRGIDTVGHVVHCNNLFDLPTQNEYRDVLCGKPQRLVSKFKLSYPLVFNLLRSNQTEGDAFVRKSMLQIELDQAATTSRQTTQQQQTLYDQTLAALATIHTPVTLCQEFFETQQNLSLYSAKKQKEIQTKTNQWKSQYSSFVADTALYKANQDALKSLKKEQEELAYIENYTQHHLDQLTELLTENGFIDLSLTPDGLTAAHLHEIHPLLGADLLRYTSFMTYTPEQMVSVLSIFTDISLPEDQRAYGPPATADPLVIKDLCVMGERAEAYARQELARGLYSPEVCFTYDLVGVMGAWCACETEEACKAFLHRTIADISLGDFTKAVLKIVVIVKEFKAVAEMTENWAFLTALNQVEPLVLKYVATNQSLYV